MQSEKIILGILAHVDSGKTTLAEALLYKCGVIRERGRVDHKDAYLDTFELEKARGITIFAKQAELEMAGRKITLMDTPGHTDFSTEMERSLRVLDYAVLVISASTGISGYTLTLWKLLEKYHIPTIVFVNKMDQVGYAKGDVKNVIQERLSSDCIDFELANEEFHETIATVTDETMEHYINNNVIQDSMITKLINNRKIFPCLYGSALQMDGIDVLIQKLSKYLIEPAYGSEFGAQVFKISRDKQGNKLTHLKITGGELKVKDAVVKYSKSGEVVWKEKINQISITSGKISENTLCVKAGEICIVTGLLSSRVGQGLGVEKDMTLPLIEPVIAYQLEFPHDINIHQIYVSLKEYEEEEPSLAFEINSKSKKIQAKVMGQVQLEVLQSIFEERYKVKVEFSENTIIYKETIKDRVVGIGHFEPLKHYAEVHLCIEPIERGAGVVVDSQCKVEECSANWQNLVLTHLKEIVHTGVAVGAELTDVRISLIAAAGHEKHTEGGDFREATHRALKQGLMQAEPLILEPVYKYEIEVPLTYMGRVLSDIGIMEGTFESPIQKVDSAVIKGLAPVRTMAGYNQEVISYTKGYGQCILENGGYNELNSSEELINNVEYNIYEEGKFTPDSIFCKQGAGFNVPWQEVYMYAHLKSSVDMEENNDIENKIVNEKYHEELWIDQEEIDEILERENKNSGRKRKTYKQKPQGSVRVSNEMYSYRPKVRKEEYLLVDGYNIIFAWQELKELAEGNLESATGKLLEILSNYQGVKGNKLIVVFDAYKVQGREETKQRYHNISVVYTKEAESADGYIEKITHKLAREFDVVVATSDVVEQLIIMGQGARKMTAKQLREEVEFVKKDIKENYLDVKKETLYTMGELLKKM